MFECYVPLWCMFQVQQAKSGYKDSPLMWLLGAAGYQLERLHAMLGCWKWPIYIWQNVKLPEESRGKIDGHDMAWFDDPLFLGCHPLMISSAEVDFLRQAASLHALPVAQSRTASGRSLRRYGWSWIDAATLACLIRGKMLLCKCRIFWNHFIWRWLSKISTTHWSNNDDFSQFEISEPLPSSTLSLRNDTACCNEVCLPVGQLRRHPNHCLANAAMPEFSQRHGPHPHWCLAADGPSCRSGEGRSVRWFAELRTSNAGTPCWKTPVATWLLGQVQCQAWNIWNM